MNATMSKPKKTTPKSGDTPKKTDVLYARLDKATQDALQRFIDAQIVPPDRTAVTIKALHLFLQTHGFWPPAGEK